MKDLILTRQKIIVQRANTEGAVGAVKCKDCIHKYVCHYCFLAGQHKGSDKPEFGTGGCGQGHKVIGIAGKEKKT